MVEINPKLLKLLKEANVDGVIHCPQCQKELAPDVKKCGDCGWENMLVKGGYI